MPAFLQPKEYKFSHYIAILRTYKETNASEEDEDNEANGEKTKASKQDKKRKRVCFAPPFFFFFGGAASGLFILWGAHLCPDVDCLIWQKQSSQVYYFKAEDEIICKVRN
jgi:hypothetical protein